MQYTINASTHILPKHNTIVKTPTSYKTHIYTHTPTHYKTHSYTHTHPHITKPTHTHTHTHTHYKTLHNKYTRRILLHVWQLFLIIRPHIHPEPIFFHNFNNHKLCHIFFVIHKGWRFAITDKCLAGYSSERPSWCRDSDCCRCILPGSTDKGCEGFPRAKQTCRLFWRRYVIVSYNIFCYSQLRNATNITRKITQVRQALVWQQIETCSLWDMRRTRLWLCRGDEVRSDRKLPKFREIACLRPQRSGVLLPPIIFTLNTDAGVSSKCG
jgi:hypothetical protein